MPTMTRRCLLIMMASLERLRSPPKSSHETEGLQFALHRKHRQDQGPVAVGRRAYLSAAARSWYSSPGCLLRVGYYSPLLASYSVTFRRHPILSHRHRRTSDYSFQLPHLATNSHSMFSTTFFNLPELLNTSGATATLRKLSESYIFIQRS